MSKNILVAYATRYGSTQEVADRIAATLRSHEHTVTVQAAKDVKTLDGYEAVVLGAPLYIGSLLKDMHNLLEKQQPALAQRPVAFFALGPVGTEEEEMQGSQEQLDKELAKHPWLQPVTLALFVGKYDPSKLGFPFNLLNKLPASPLAGLPASDNRDWDAITAWAQEVAAALG